MSFRTEFGKRFFVIFLGLAFLPVNVFTQNPASGQNLDAPVSQKARDLLKSRITLAERQDKVSEIFIDRLGNLRYRSTGLDEVSAQRNLEFVISKLLKK